MTFLKRHTQCVFSLALLFICFGSLAKAKNVDPSAHKVLARMTATYATASSYQDSGVVRLVPHDPLIANRKTPFLQNVALQSDTLISFKTYYLRPNRFRFEWKISSQTEARESVVWFDGKRAYSWMPSVSGDGSFNFTSSLNFSLHVDEALSSSLGSVYFVPSLLLQKLIVAPFSGTVRTAKQVTIVREELMDGETCYVIKAHLAGVPWLLWVGKESYLLRKTRTLYSARSFHPSNKSVGQSFIAEEIHTNIRINRDVPKSLFRYRPVLGPKDLDSTERKKGASYDQRLPRPPGLVKRTYWINH